VSRQYQAAHGAYFAYSPYMSGPLVQDERRSKSPRRLAGASGVFITGLRSQPRTRQREMPMRRQAQVDDTPRPLSAR
jgi:hypothetical protein